MGLRLLFSHTPPPPKKRPDLKKKNIFSIVGVSEKDVIGQGEWRRREDSALSATNIGSQR